MNIDKSQFNQLAKKYDLKLLLAFGSQVGGDINKDSDFDIAYISNKKIDNLVDLNCDLIDIVNNDKVDMVDLRNANPLLKYEISNKSELLYGNELDYLEFKASAFKEYVDGKPLFELQNLLIKRRQELIHG